jgi:hypothetical protein
MLGKERNTYPLAYDWYAYTGYVDYIHKYIRAHNLLLRQIICLEAEKEKNERKDKKEMKKKGW